MSVERIRKMESLAALSLCTFAALFGLFWLVFILGDVLINGIGALNLSLFVNDPAPPGVEGGG